MHLTVLQWNVWFKENIERVIDVLKAQDADIICLQELTRGYIEQSQENTWEYIAHGLGYEYRVQEIPIVTPEAQWSQANAIFSRYPITNKVVHWIHEPRDFEDLTDQYRGYLEITVDVKGNHFTIATTHMSFNTDPNNDQELQTLLSIVDSKQSHFILTADLNALPDSQRVAELEKRLHHAGPPYDQKTWTTKPFRHEDFEAATLDWRYDFVFTSQDVNVADARIVQTDVSDHLPILTAIELPKQAV